LGKTWGCKEEDECHGKPIKGRVARKRTNITRGWGGGMRVYMFQKTQGLGKNSREPKRKMMNIKMKSGVEWESNGRQIEFPMGVE
jgi:hypothetical protein